MSLNRYEAIGHLGKDATTRTLDNGHTAISFTVGVTEKYKTKSGEEKTSTLWVNCTKWVGANGSTAVVPYLKKGTQVFIEGKPSVRKYESANGDGVSFELNVNNVQLLSKVPGTNQEERSEANYPENELGINATDDLPF